ncbi:hypothetical protein Mapa_011290 [Marchantia paleacea]|nr:hypothetical protein Mapa_011290 [Marchantia paleacea]
MSPVEADATPSCQSRVTRVLQSNKRRASNRPRLQAFPLSNTAVSELELSLSMEQTYVGKTQFQNTRLLEFPVVKRHPQFDLRLLLITSAISL